jgi:hypothetical protein
MGRRLLCTRYIDAKSSIASTNTSTTNSEDTDGNGNRRISEG